MQQALFHDNDKINFRAYSSAYSYPTTFALPIVKCESGWIPYHTACYKFYNQPMSFDDANAQCNKGTGHFGDVTLLT